MDSFAASLFLSIATPAHPDFRPPNTRHLDTLPLTTTGKSPYLLWPASALPPQPRMRAPSLSPLGRYLDRLFRRSSDSPRGPRSALCCSALLCSIAGRARLTAVGRCVCWSAQCAQDLTTAQLQLYPTRHPRCSPGLHALCPQHARLARRCDYCPPTLASSDCWRLSTRA